MSSYRYNVIIDVQINTTGAKQGAGQVSGAFTQIENEAKTASANIQGHFDQVGGSLDKVSAKTNVFAAAFKGAFVGAVTGLITRTIVHGIEDIIGGIEHLTVSAVQAAAEFERITNSVAVFAGSVSAATSELASLDNAARNTPGLKLETAELGFSRLRALGFEAKLAEDFIIGIGKQALISGANEGGVQRFILALEKLKANSANAGQELRALSKDIPSVTQVFRQEFGTFDAGKIKALIDANPDLFYSRLARAMKESQIAAPGLSAALISLQNAFLETERAFGKPLLGPLTDDMQSLTKFLYSNMSVWQSWGDTVGHIISGINRLLDLTNSPTPTTPNQALTQRGIQEGKTAALSSLPLVGASVVGGPIGAIVVAGLGLVGEADKFITRNDPLRSTAGGTVTAKVLADEAQKELDVKRKEVSDMIALSKEGYAIELNDLTQSQNVELAQRASHLRDNLEEEMSYQSEISQIKIRGIQASATKQEEEINATLKIMRAHPEQFDIETIRKTELQKAKIRTDASAAVLIELANNVEKQATLDRQLRSQQRQLAIEHNNFELQGMKQLDDARTFDIERQITQTGQGYADLVRLTDQTWAEQSGIIAKNLAIQLQDETLTQQQIVNLKLKADLDEKALAEKHREDIIKIQDRQNEALIQRLQAYRQNASEILKDVASLYGATQSFFSPSTFSSTTFGAFQNVLSSNGLQGRVNAANAADRAAGLRFTAGQAAGLAPETLKLLQDAFNKTTLEASNLNIELDAFSKKIPVAIQQFAALADQINEHNIEAFDEIAKRTLAYQQQLAREDLIETVAHYKELAVLETDVTKKSEFRFQAQKAQRQLDLLLITQSAEALDLYNKTLDGINKRYDELLKKDPKTLGALARVLTGNIGEARNAALQDYRSQELLLGDKNLVNMQRETEYLKDIVALRGDELNAVFRIDKAQLELGQKLIYSKNKADASVLEFLASQKGITEIVSDLKINMLTTAYSGLDAVATRLTRSFGAFRDVIRDLIANLLKLALNTVFQKMFPQLIGAGGSGGGFGGVPTWSGGAIPGINIGSGLGGFGGFGGTPNFNPDIQTYGGGSFNPYGIPLSGGNNSQYAQTGGLLGPGSNPGASGGALGGLFGSGGFSGLLKSLGSALPFLGAGLGAGLGGSSALGGLLGGVGGLGAGLLGGIATGALNAGTLFGGIFGAGHALSIGGLSAGLSATVILAPIAAALLIGSFLIGRNSQRRKDEVARATAINDALAQLDKMILDVNSDRLDGAAALDQASQIRANYLNSVSQLKDTKTRNIAIADVSRIDIKIDALKTALGSQISRKARLDLLVPTFAGGGAVNMGFQRGGEQIGYFPGAGTYARFNERGSEYILDAETTNNIGVSRLDSLRASRGRSLAPIQGYASGGTVVSPTSTNAPVTLEVSLQVGLSTESFVSVISSAIRGNDGSREQITAIAKSLKDQGHNELAAIILKQGGITT